MVEVTPKPQIGGYVALGIDVGFSTDTGRVRQRNEDNFFVCDPAVHDIANRGLLFAVADGMGGHQGGQTASALAVEVLLEFYSGPSSAEEHPVDFVAALIDRANDTIFARATGDPDLTRMGTTLTACHLAGRRHLTLFHIGDSRALLLRKGILRQLTNDHSLVADQLRAGIITPEEAACHPARNVITRALGTRRSVNADVYSEELEPGDRLLVCCDGLHGVVPPGELVELLLSSETSEKACKRLTDRANELGGPDNITMVVLHIRRPRGFWNWLRGVFSPGQP